MVTWIGTAVGLFFIVGGILALLILLFEDLENNSWWSRAFGVAMCAAVTGGGVWLAWPLVLGVRDLFVGTEEAHKLVGARELARSSSVQAEYGGFRQNLKVGALLWALSAPFLFWRMRRGEPDLKRAWALLAAIPVGYAVLVQWRVSLFASSPMEQWLKTFLDRNDTIWVFTLYAETMWLGTMIFAFFAGLPVGPCTILLVPLAFVPYLIGYYLDYPFWKQMLCFGASIVVGGILNGVRLKEEESERTRRIFRAHEFERKVLSSDKEGDAFALYLRPFRSTGTLDVQQVSANVDPLDFETILAAAVRPELRLLGLNRPGATRIIGADYLYHADSDWWTTFQRLAHMAKIIFVLPSTGWTAEEIVWLRDQRLLEKCIFMMPETITGRGWQAGIAVPTTVKHIKHRDFNHSPDWAAARQAIFERAGLDLPIYRCEGALFMLHYDGRLKAIAPLRLASVVGKVRRTRKALKNVRRSTAVSSGR